MSLTISGYAAIFKCADSQGDVFARNAFIIPENVPMLLSHRPGLAVGAWCELKQTLNGLSVRGVVRDSQACARLREGWRGLSVGFRTYKATTCKCTRRISAAALIEVSIVREPMHPSALINNVQMGEVWA